MEYSLSIVVLAGGAGTRMRSRLPKVLHPLCGRPALQLVLDVADALQSHKQVVVVSPSIKDIIAETLGPRYSYVVQEQALGTGHAVAQARDILRGQSSHVLVLYGDSPLIRAETAAKLIDAVRNSGARVGLLSFEANPPTGYGRVLRDTNGAVMGLVEERDASDEQRRITEVNSGFMCFDAEWLWERIDALTPSASKGEYYLTDMVALAVNDFGPGAAVAVSTSDEREAWGVNSRLQLAQAEAVLRERRLNELMESGVTIVDPSATYIDMGVTVEPDATILPGCVLQGNSYVASGCVVGPHVQLVNTKLGAASKVRFAVLEDQELPAGSEVAPFSYKYAHSRD